MILTLCEISIFHINSTRRSCLSGSQMILTTHLRKLEIGKCKSIILFTVQNQFSQFTYFWNYMIKFVWDSFKQLGLVELIWNVEVSQKNHIAFVELLDFWCFSFFEKIVLFVMPAFSTNRPKCCLIYSVNSRPRGGGITGPRAANLSQGRWTYRPRGG